MCGNEEKVKVIMPKQINKKKYKKIIPGIYYNSGFLNGPKRHNLINEIEEFHPIWEERYCECNPPPEGDTWRALKRPVYWLGNWQFACLGYYHPPHDINFRCAKAESFPPLMQKLVDEIEQMTRRMAPKKDVPEKWHLNTCLINYYGSRLTGDSIEDVATVGDHKDAEPGPVASISLGERAWFQFVKGRPNDPKNVVHEQWLEDASLLIFWGKKFKDELFHRVQRVEDKKGQSFKDYVEDYRTRRINLTFRYVPTEDIIKYSEFPEERVRDTKDYVEKLADFSKFWKNIFTNL
jgi:alkylated DNA repair protein (DNA oxidative demethylase)